MKIWNEIWDYVKMIIIVVVVVLVVNNVVLINAKIPSESMENTIMTGDRIFGFRMAYGLNFDFFGKHISYKTKDPERFDIIIFKFPDDESQLFIKRLIGLPGETVELSKDADKDEKPAGAAAEAGVAMDYGSGQGVNADAINALKNRYAGNGGTPGKY